MRILNLPLPRTETQVLLFIAFLGASYLAIETRAAYLKSFQRGR